MPAYRVHNDHRSESDPGLLQLSGEEEGRPGLAQEEEGGDRGAPGLHGGEEKRCAMKGVSAVVLLSLTTAKGRDIEDGNY